MGNCLGRSKKYKKLRDLIGSSIESIPELNNNLTSFYKRKFANAVTDSNNNMNFEQFIEFFAWLNYSKQTLISLFHMLNHDDKFEITFQSIIFGISILAQSNKTCVYRILFYLYCNINNQIEGVQQKSYQLFKTENAFAFRKKKIYENINQVIQEEPEDMMQSGKIVKAESTNTKSSKKLQQAPQNLMSFMDKDTFQKVLDKQFNLSAFQQYILTEDVKSMQLSILVDYQKMNLFDEKLTYNILSIKWWENYKLYYFLKHAQQIREIRDSMHMSSNHAQKRISSIEYTQKYNSLNSSPDKSLHFNHKTNSFRESTLKTTFEIFNKQLQWGPPIDNSNLNGIFAGQLMKNIFSNSDYIVIQRKLYKKLQILYGGGEDFERTLNKGYLELYPLFIREYKYKDGKIESNSFELNKYSNRQSVYKILNKYDWGTIFYFKNIGQKWKKLRVNDEKIGECDFQSNCFLVNLHESQELEFKKKYDIPPSLSNPLYGNIFWLTTNTEFKEVCVIEINDLQITFHNLTDSGPRQYTLQVAQMQKKIKFPNQSNVVKYQQYGGLMNLGNTCYINASLSALFFHDLMNGYFKKITSIDRDSTIYGLILEIRNNVEQGKLANPLKFKKKICQAMQQFRGDEQHDSHEFLIRLIDYCEQNQLKFLSSSQILFSLLNGKSRNQFICQKCDSKRIKNQDLKILSLPIKPQTTIEYKITLRSDFKNQIYIIRVKEDAKLQQLLTQFQSLSKIELNQYGMYQIYKNDVIKNITNLDESMTLKKLYIKPEDELCAYTYIQQKKFIKPIPSTQVYANYFSENGTQILCEIEKKIDEEYTIFLKLKNQNMIKKKVSAKSLSPYPNTLLNKQQYLIKALNRDSYDLQKIGTPLLLNIPQWYPVSELIKIIQQKLKLIAKSEKSYFIRFLNKDLKCFICNKKIRDEIHTTFFTKTCNENCYPKDNIPIQWIYRQVTIVIDWIDLQSFTKSLRYKVIQNLEQEDVTTIQQCLQQNFISQKINLDCQKCLKRHQHTSTVKLQLPKLLIIHLKRFKYDLQMKKISTKFKLQENIELKKYSIDTSKNQNYNLIGIICHQGNGYHGHYVSVIKKGNQWILINDSSVKNIRLQQISQKSIYILFYSLQE